MKKKALITSILSIVMCLCLMTGATFALFTSTSTVNVAVTSGTVGVVATVTNTETGTTLGGDAYGTITDNGNGTYALNYMVAGDWAKFTIEVNNNSTVDVQYRIVTALSGELADEMTVQIADENANALANSGYTKWMSASANESDLGVYTVTFSIAEDNTTANGGKTANLALIVEAIQGNAVASEVTNQVLLTNALEMGGEVTVVNDITLPAEEGIVIAEGVNSTLDLNGKNIVVGAYNLGHGAILNNGSLTIDGDGVISAKAMNDGYGAIHNKGTLIVNDGTIQGANWGGSTSDFPDYAVVNNGGSTTVNGGNFEGTFGAICNKKGDLLINGGNFTSEEIPGCTRYLICGFGDSATVINDGNFTFTCTGANSTGACLIGSWGNNTVEINGGVFDANEGAFAYSNDSIVIKGGTFKNSAKKVYGGYTIEKFVADGYKVVEVDGALVVVSEAVSTWSGAVDTTWYDATKTEVKLDSADQLAGLASLVANGEDFAGVTVKLDKNIDLNGVAWAPIGEGVRSGKTANGNVFSGVFDGGYMTVSGLNIVNASEDDAVGLFGIVTGTVKNVNIANSTVVTNSENAGFVAGLVVGGVIENCSTDANSAITAAEAGGIVGRVLTDGTIAKCTNNATVTATAGGGAAGGIACKAYYTVTDCEMNITDCVNNGAVTAPYAVGGIVGLSAANVSGCVNNATVSSQMAGGIIGEQVNYGEVKNNVNTATVTATVLPAGGIIGFIRYQNNASYQVSEVITVSGNKNSGDIYANGTDGLRSAGGIVGEVYNQAIVTNNENTCAIVSGTNFASGIVGTIQESSANLMIDGAKYVISDNTYSSATVITGTCTNEVVYNNLGANEKVVIENNLAN